MQSIKQSEKDEEDLHALLPNNPFVPPKGGVCHINRLPSELISRIFEVGFEDDDESDDEQGIMPDFWESSGDDEDDEEITDDVTESHPFPPFPIVVSCVCHLWRSISFSTPSLWTTIVVTPVAYAPYPLEWTHLKRSKNVPVDIYVKCQLEGYEKYVDRGPSDVDLIYLFGMLLFFHIHRWRTMEVSVSKYHHMDLFLDAFSHPSTPAAPQLTTLALYHYHEDTEDLDDVEHPGMSKHPTLFGGSAPLLTTLILYGVHVDWNQPWIAAASNLTVLHLAFHPQAVRPSWTQFTAILRGASSLEKLSLCQSGPSGDPSEWFIEPIPGGPADLNAPVHLARVTDLVLGSHPQVHAIGLLRKLHLPALKNLVLTFENGDYTDLVHELARPATSLSPSQEQPRSLLSRLENLHLANLPCSSECAETLYGELQNLTSLNIRFMNVPSEFLDILCTPCRLSGQGDVWLPRLQTLRVSETDGYTLEKVIKYRKDAGVPLSALYVEKWSEVYEEEAGRLKENVETFEFFDDS